MKRPTDTTYVANVDPSSPNDPNVPHLREAVRTVLGSRQKLALLCVLDAGPLTTRELAERLTGTLRRQALNLHLSELQTLGLVEVTGGIDRHPNHPREWGLSTEPFWTELAQTINDVADARLPIEQPTE